MVRARGRLSNTTAAAILLGFLVAASAAAAPAARPDVRIDNFGQVNATYYRGSQPLGQDYTDLARLGVKTVINLTSDDADATEPGLVREAGMQYVQIAMTTHREPTGEQIAQFLKIVNDPASQPVYVHCVGGKHRTGVMTAVYRMTKDAWTSDRAFSEMKQFEFGADFLHAEFKKFVYGYPAELTRTAALAASAPTKADATVKSTMK